MEGFIDIMHSATALIFAITFTISAATILTRKMNEFIDGLKIILNSITKKEKFKMTKSIKIFTITTSLFLIGIVIFGIRGYNGNSLPLQQNKNKCYRKFQHYGVVFGLCTKLLKYYLFGNDL